MIFKGTAKHVGIGGYYMIDILFLTAAVLVSSFNTFENQSYDDIEIYEQRLEKFNEVYGTFYAIPEKPVVGGDIVEFYTSMTLNEFDKYIMSIYDGSYYDTEAPSLKNDSGGERLEIRSEYYVADYTDK